MSDTPKRRKSSPRVHKRYLKKLAFRPPVDTYGYLQEKYPEEKRHLMSYRKQMCFLYIKWMVYPKDDNLRHQVVELVKAWRTAEPNRFGGKRTLMEKLFRKKLFKKHRQEKRQVKAKDRKAIGPRKQMETGTGRHTPELIEQYKTSEYGRMMASRPRKKKNIDWVIYSPDGEIFHVQDIAAFCEEHGLHKSHLANTSTHPGWRHRGWFCRKKNPHLDLIDFTDDEWFLD